MHRGVRECVVAVAVLVSGCLSTSAALARGKAPARELCGTVRVYGRPEQVCNKLGSTPPHAHRSTLPAGPPRLLIIPRIGVRTSVEVTALRSAWDWEAPHIWWDASWYSRGPRPGDPGRALIFGHLDSTCCPALFWNLGTLRPGDTVTVDYRTGHPLTFRVAWKNVYWNNARSVRWVFQRTPDRVLVLVTCAGLFYPGRGYDRRLLVYAHLVGKGY